MMFLWPRFGLDLEKLHAFQLRRRENEKWGEALHDGLLTNGIALARARPYC
jgi:hypothetical protein